MIRRLAFLFCLLVSNFSLAEIEGSTKQAENSKSDYAQAAASIANAVQIPFWNYEDEAIKQILKFSLNTKNHLAIEINDKKGVTAYAVWRDQDNKVHLVQDRGVPAEISQRASFRVSQPLSYDKYKVGTLTLYVVRSVEKIQLSDAEREYLAAHPVIRASNETDYPPYDFAIGGKPQGYSIDLLDLLAQRIGFKVEYLTGPSWDELVELHKKGKLDLLHSLSNTPERAKIGLFSDPYIRLKTVFVTRKGDPDIANFDQLHGKTVAVAIAWAEDEFLRTRYPGINRLRVSNLEKMLEAVSNGEADTTFENDGAVSYWLSKKGLSDLKIAGWAKEFDNGIAGSFHFYARKDAPQLVSMLNKALASLPPGELQALQNKWFGATAISSETRPIALTLEQQAYLAKKGEIKMCVDPDWMPVERITPNGTHVGMTADLMAKFSEKLATKIVLVPTRTWQETLDSARARQCDIISAGEETPARKEFLDFTKPYISFPAVIATDKHKVFISNIQSVLHERFGVVKGYAVIEKLKIRYPGINLVEVDSAREGLLQVQQGKLFGFIDAVSTIAYQIQAQGFLDLKISGQLDSGTELRIPTRNDEPMLKDVMQAAIDAISLEEREAVVQHWLSTRFETVTDYSLILKLLSVSVFFIVAVIYWNRRLSKLNRSLDLAHADLRRRSEELSVALNELNVIFQNASVGIVFVVNRHIVRVNKTCEIMLGYTASEMIGQSTRRFYPSQEMYDAVAAAYMELAKGQTTSKMDVIFRRANGTDFTCEGIATHVDPSDLSKGTVWLYTDVTELRRAQSQLIQSEKMASIGQLVANVAHEINSPIGAVKSSGQSISVALGNVIEKLQVLIPLLDQDSLELFFDLIGHSKTLTESSLLTQSTREYRTLTLKLSRQLTDAGIENARQKAEVLVKLRADDAALNYLPLLRHPNSELIMDLAHGIATIGTSAGAIGYAVARVDKIVSTLKSFTHSNGSSGMKETNLKEGIETVLMIYQNRINQGTELICQYDDDLTVIAQPGELNQVWTHLIHNALQAMSNHGKIRICLRRVGDEAMVSISDTGVGIPEAIQGRIFEPFFTTRPAGEGAGLGLDIVKKIVDRHKGRIEMQSIVDQGTTFSVYLPCQRVA